MQHVYMLMCGCNYIYMHVDMFSYVYTTYITIHHNMNTIIFVLLYIDNIQFTIINYILVTRSFIF